MDSTSIMLDFGFGSYILGRFFFILPASLKYLFLR